MKKNVSYLIIILALAATVPTKSGTVLAASYVEFNPAKAQFVSPDAKKKERPAIKSASLPKPQAVSLPNAEQMKGLMFETINDFISRGAFKGEKGEKGDKGDDGRGGASAPAPSHDQNIAGFQPVHIPSFAIADVGTFFSATNLSSDNIASKSADFLDANLNGKLTVAGDAELKGNSVLSTTTASSLRVGTLTSDSGAHLSKGGAWTNASSRELKENFATTSPEDILEKINALPVYFWNYKNEDSSVTHMSPMAEDFYDLFRLGGKDGNKSISTIDPAGVALAGIKALNKKLAAQTFDISWFINGLKDIGVEINNGKIKVTEFVADIVSVKTLEVGTSENPSGITVYDRATRKPMCIFSENAVLKAEQEKCGAAQGTTTVPEIPEAVLNVVSATTSVEVLKNNQE